MRSAGAHHVEKDAGVGADVEQTGTLQGYMGVDHRDQLAELVMLFLEIEIADRLVQVFLGLQQAADGDGVKGPALNQQTAGPATKNVIEIGVLGEPGLTVAFKV